MKYVTLGESVYFWFAINDVAGSGNDGATPAFDVRKGGAAADAIPTLSGTPTLLTHANYPNGCHEVAIAATALNGFEADASYGVFATVAVSSQNPAGFVGEFKLSPIPANMKQISDDDVAADNFETMLDGTGGKELTLGRLVVSGNTAGGAVLIENLYATGDGVRISGMRTGVSIGGNRFGANIVGTESGLYCEGTSGPGLDVYSVAGQAVRMQCETAGQDALQLIRSGAGRAVYSDGAMQFDGGIGTIDFPETSIPPTAGAIADAVWDEDASEHLGIGTFGAVVAAIATAVATVASKLLKYVQLLARADAAIAADNATELAEINADEGSGPGDFVNATDALEAIREKQDVGGGSTSIAGDYIWTTDRGSKPVTIEDA